VRNRGSRLDELGLRVHQVIWKALPSIVVAVAHAGVVLGGCNSNEDPSVCAGVPVSFACTHVDDVSGARSPGILGTDGWCSVDPHPECPRMPACADAEPGQRCWVNRNDPSITRK